MGKKWGVKVGPITRSEKIEHPFMGCLETYKHLYALLDLVSDNIQQMVLGSDLGESLGQELRSA